MEERTSEGTKVRRIRPRDRADLDSGRERLGDPEPPWTLRYVSCRFVVSQEQEVHNRELHRYPRDGTSNFRRHLVRKIRLGCGCGHRLGPRRRSPAHQSTKTR